VLSFFVVNRKPQLLKNPYVVAYVNTIELINSFPEKSKATDKLIRAQQ